MDTKELSGKIAKYLVIGITSHWSLLFFFASILVWLVVGIFLDFSHTWQYSLHIVLAIVTFIIVLLIEHVQHRETRSMQIKLDELLKGVEGARNDFINIQEKPDHQLDKLQAAVKESKNDNQGSKVNKSPAIKPTKIKDAK